MRSYRKCWVPFLGLIILLLSSSVACGKPGYATYKNGEMGYAISYPYNWQVEVSEDGTKCFIVSPTRRASVMIDVAAPMAARDAANRWIMALGTAHNELTQFENEPRQDFWDWYLSYDWEAEYGLYHGEAYFKQTEKRLYKVDTAAFKNEYEYHKFNSIISTFKLLGK